MSEAKNQERRKTKRYHVQTKVEFFIDTVIVNATTIDISETGMKLQSETPLNIRMRMELDGTLQERSAKLVWARQNSDGSMTYGFE